MPGAGVQLRSRSQVGIRQHAVHRERWHAMAAGLPYSDGRCLLGRDYEGVAVAEVTVWSAALEKPGPDRTRAA
jgi:hypothetical protein